MTEQQIKHLTEIKNRFSELVSSKYKKGAEEHGGFLPDKPGLIDMAIEEAVDQFVYLHTLKDQTVLSREGRKVICVDMDGTLCEGEAWTEEAAMNAEPRTDIIEKIDELYKKHFICIYTARGDNLMPATLAWLRKYVVKFHAISNNKLGCDLYIEDKAKRPEEL